MLTPPEQAAFEDSARRVQRAAAAQLRQEPGPAGAIGFVRQLQRGVDRVFANALEAGASVDCAKGCSHCCSVRVQAMAPEVFRIVDALRQLAPDALAALTARLRRHADGVRSKPLAEHRAPCPLLEDGACSVYALRPAVCRKGHSLNVRACAERQPLIPQHLRIIVESEALMRGTAAGYAEVGLRAGSHELGQAVLVALTEPDAAQRWAAGAAVFDEAGAGEPP